MTIDNPFIPGTYFTLSIRRKRVYVLAALGAGWDTVLPFDTSSQHAGKMHYAYRWIGTINAVLKCHGVQLVLDSLQDETGAQIKKYETPPMGIDSPDRGDCEQARVAVYRVVNF